jgi:glucokinase
MATYAGLDVGATSIGALVGDEEGSVLGQAERSTPDGGAGETVTRAALGALEAACATADVPPTDLDGVGIGTLGPLDSADGAVVDPPNLDVDRIPLRAPVRDLVDADVHLRNDAVAGAIGERFYGPTTANLVYLTISTGLGAGAIVDGRVLRGAHGNAAEVGHLTLDPASEQPCGCGGTGHWEAFCAGAHLPSYARRLAAERGFETALDLETLTPADLFAAPTDPLAEAVLERFGAWNAQGVAALVHAYDPERVAIGGGVAVTNPTWTLDPIRERLPGLTVTEPPPVALATEGRQAGPRGALALAVTHGAGDERP